MTSKISFSIRSAAPRKRKRAVRSGHGDGDGSSAVVAQVAACFMVQDEGQSKESGRVTKKPLLLEDAHAKAKRLRDEGNTLADAGRFQAAMQRWQESLVINKEDAVTYELMAQASMAVYDDFQAAQYALRATQLAPTWGDAFHTLARAHLNFGELELAHENIKKAAELLVPTKDLLEDRAEIEKLLQQQEQVLLKRDQEAAKERDEGKLQAISCLKYLSLRGRAHGP